MIMVSVPNQEDGHSSMSSSQSPGIVSPSSTASTISTSSISSECEELSVLSSLPEEEGPSEQQSVASEEQFEVSSVNESRNTQAETDDDDDDEEEDPDFNPTSPTNTPQEALSEEDSDGEEEEGENQGGRRRRRGSTSTPVSRLQESRKRPATTSSEELASRQWKVPKLVSVHSSRTMSVPTGIPRTRIAFLSAKPSDIGLGGDLKRTGLTGVLAAIRSQKQTKLTTLEKSRLDWQAFKQAEGLEDELKNQLKSRNGYLEKRDFLERTDHRQFEIERDMRAKHRRNPLGS